MVSTLGSGHFIRQGETEKIVKAKELIAPDSSIQESLSSQRMFGGRRVRGLAIFIPFCLFVWVTCISCASEDKHDELTLHQTKKMTDSSVGPESTMSATDRSKQTGPRQTKINLSISSMLDQLRDKGVTRQTITESDAKSLSTQLVRIDKRGRIQAYIDVDAIDSDLLTNLKEKGVDIELSNASLRIIQAWVPFDRIEELAMIESVRRIRPPDYGIPRPEAR
jgi:hypothetical protein